MRTEDRTQDTEGKCGGRTRVRFRVSHSLCCLLSTVFCISLAGCNIVGAVMAKVGPPPTIKAQYVLPKQPTLILVENFHNPASLRLESDAIVRHLVGEFELHKMTPVIDPSKAESLRQEKGAAYRKMPLDAIGTAVGAKQVIYVDLQHFQVTNAIASEQLTGEAEAHVRVVDDTGTVLWPIDSAAGFPVVVKIEPDPAPTAAGDHATRNRLHAALADRVAKLFYDWKSDDPGAGTSENKF
jgi:hypothetical protein